MNPERRILLAAMAASPALLLPSVHAAAAAAARGTPQRLQLPPDGGFPNSAWPVLFYQAAYPARTPDLAGLYEKEFAAHGWPPQWRYGMYPFDHFHSTAHEALGIFSGHARVRLGGPHGRELGVSMGDVLVLPAGTGHAALESSSDFMMVGAYPQGQSWDMQRGDPSKLGEVRQAIANVPRPQLDPLGHPLQALWP